MKRVSLLLAVLLILPVFSCSRHEINSNEGDKVGEFMTFKATLGDLEEMSTRTEFQSSMTTTKWPIYWMPGDAINIFYGNKSEARFETSESFVEKGPVAEFEGYLQAATGAVADDGGTTTQNFWAVYPYNGNNTCDGSSVTMTIPDVQEGKAGSFANNLNPTVACSPNMGLAFYNVGGWLVFTVSQENVVSATLQGANGETLVGKVKVSMDENNHPQVDEVTDGKTSITMTPEGGSFEVGQIYCFVILPQIFEDGVILTLEKPDGFKATCEWKPSDGSTLSVARSKWSGKLNIDKDADYKKEGNIVFADEKVKAICVSNWDTNGDEELSYEEAAAVTRIPYGLFSDRTDISSFDEFQFFTGVTSFGSSSVYTTPGSYGGRTVIIGAFSNSSLRSIKWPATIKTIPKGAFNGCAELLSIEFVSGCTSIGQEAFKGCTGLTNLIIPNSISELGDYVFEGCSGITNISIPNSITSLPQGFIKDCVNLKDIVIPEGIISIGYEAFGGCIDISVTLPTTIESLRTDQIPNTSGAFGGAFYKTSLNVLTVPVPLLPNNQWLDGGNLISGHGIDRLPSAKRLIILNPNHLDYTLQNSFYYFGFEEIEFADGLKGIDINYSISSNLRTVIIPNGCLSIGDFAFSNSQLISLTIPETVTSIGRRAFSGCKELSSIILYPIIPPTAGSELFYEANNCLIYVPAESVDAYKTAEGWSDYADRIQGITKPFPEGNSFDEDAYITYVANHQEWQNQTNEVLYAYDTQFNAGVSGTRMEMKFKIPDYDSGEAILSYHSDGGLAIDASNVSYYYNRRHHEDGDTWYEKEFTQGVGEGIDGTGTVVLTASCNGNQIEVTVNGNEATIPVSVSSLNSQYIFSHYDMESGDGTKYEYLAGVPDGAKLYYVKIWNGDELVYFGHASRAVCSYSSEEEYCWYEEIGNNYTFARSLHSLTSSEFNNPNPSYPIATVRQSFGGGMD